MEPNQAMERVCMLFFWAFSLASTMHLLPYGVFRVFLVSLPTRGNNIDILVNTVTRERV